VRGLAARGSAGGTRAVWLAAGGDGGQVDRQARGVDWDAGDLRGGDHDVGHQEQPVRGGVLGQHAGGGAHAVDPLLLRGRCVGVCDRLGELGVVVVPVVVGVGELADVAGFHVGDDGHVVVLVGE